MIAWVIEEEFGVNYRPGHVRKLLHALFSVQRPRRVLARANPVEQDRWHRRTYPQIKENPLAKLGSDLYRRSQFPSGLDVACHLEPDGPAARSPRHRGTQEREDSRCHRTLANSFPLPRGHGLQRLQLSGRSWSSWHDHTVGREPFSSRTTPPITRMGKFGVGPAPTAMAGGTSTAGRLILGSANLAEIVKQNSPEAIPGPPFRSDYPDFVSRSSSLAG
jgi:hypothetical protein